MTTARDLVRVIRELDTDELSALVDAIDDLADALAEDQDGIRGSPRIATLFTMLGQLAGAEQTRRTLFFAQAERQLADPTRPGP